MADQRRDAMTNRTVTTVRWLRQCVAAWLLLQVLAGSAAVRPVEEPAALRPSAEPRFESIGGQAIPRDVVPAVAQDRAGFLWVATGDGLVRYDAYAFRPQERESPVPAERNLGWIRVMLAARDGRLWIGTEAAGLAEHDPATGRIAMHPEIDAPPAGAPAAARPTIVALAEDRDGAIWIGSIGGGLVRYDRAGGRVDHYRHGPEAGSLPDDRVQALRVDRAGTLWVGTWQGLSFRRAGGDRFERVALPATRSPAGRVVQSLYEAADGRLWSGTRQGDLAVVEPATGQARPVDAAATATARRGAVTGFVQQPDGLLWVGHAGGIDLIDAAGERLLRRLRHDPGRPSGLAGNEVAGLLLDREGWIWVAGIGGGLQRHNPNNRSLSLLGLGGASGKTDRIDARALLQLDNGDIWAASSDGPIAVLDSQLALRRRLRLPAPRRPTDAAGEPPRRVDALAQARDGSVWLGGDSLLQQFSRDGRPLRSLAHGGGRTNRLLAAHDGTLWIATQEGLYRLASGMAAPQRIALAGGAPLVGEVFALAEMPEGGLWVGSVHGLYRLDRGGSELEAVRSSAGHGLGQPSVIGLLVDRQRRLWIDTGSGLHRLAGGQGGEARFDRISERHGVIGRPFGVNLLEDGRGRIWTQMNVYDPGSDLLYELTPADGADLGTGWFLSYSKTVDGRMLFGGSKGLLVVAPDAFQPRLQAPPLVVSELRINGRRRPAGPRPAELRLTRDDRNWSIDLAALDYWDAGHVRYAYQLRGFDADWTRPSAALRTASYGNLAPGDYLLRARARHDSGTWESDELQIRVRVLPAWWETWWARLALLPLAVALVALIVQLRTRRLRQRQHELEARVTERTAELEKISRALQQKSEALEATSLTDPLTGLHNRRFLVARIEHDILQVLRRHEARLRQRVPLPDDADIAFFLLDIDHFKRVNDDHGHAAGDAVLMQMRGRLQQVFRAGDYLVRWGGEEFLIVALGTSRRHVPELAERARAAVADAAFDLGGGQRLAVTCSIGFACFPPAPEWPHALEWPAVLELADAALYQVKRGGRNGWLGVLQADADSEGALREAAARPFAEWQASGALQTAGRLLGVAPSQESDAGDAHPAAD